MAPTSAGAMPPEKTKAAPLGDARPPFSPTTEAERAEMLRAIGVSSVDELLKAIPESVRRPSYRLGPGMTEMELSRHVEDLAKKNTPLLSFLGAGAYERYIPAAVWPLVLRGEYATAYTPYQPEASQGTLQAIYEFQTMVCELTGLPVANASLYDGASSLAEAVNAALRHTGRTKVVLPRSLHPHYRKTVRTYFESHPDYKIVEAAAPEGTLDLAALEAQAEDAACVVVQNPNFFGGLEDVEAVGKIAKAKGAVFIVVFEPVSLAMLKSPGECGADIAVGEGQGLGLPLSFGGPYVGLYATTNELLRRVPGRMCGRTVDRDGRGAYVLTLQAREQHIRREKASSNVCTNQALLALATTIHLSLLGPRGLREVAELSSANAHLLAELLAAVPGYKLRFAGPFFQEFALQTPRDAREVRKALLAEGLLAGLPLGDYYPELSDTLLICATETKTEEELRRLARSLARLK